MRYLAALLLVVALAGCGGSEPKRPGDVVVYQRITAETDCSVLQKEVDTALANAEARPAGDRDVPLAYAEAANARMKELGC